ncbi:hypothetical protein ACWEWU_14510 [Staphylococcus xylosus]
MKLESFTKDDMLKIHGNMYLYRNLYKGSHSEVFPRAKNLIETGEIIDRIKYGDSKAINIQTPYLIVNVAKMIVDIPSLFIRRSLGTMKTNYEALKDSSDSIEEDEDIDEVLEESREGVIESSVKSFQQHIIDQIVENTNFNKWHGMNLKQWQIDGGIVAVPEFINGQARISFKERNVYYELEDGKTYQLRYFIDYEDEEYLHVHEEVEGSESLEGSHTLYKLNFSDELELVTDPKLIELIIGIEQKDLNYTIRGRKRTLFTYLPYSPTYDSSYGQSALLGQEDKQDEINWTMTRNAQVFERNGKPRISITKEVMDRLQEAAKNKYGDSSKIDHRDLSIMSIDDNGKSMEIHQIDISKIGDVPYVKDIIKMMLMETQTSEKAIDFFNEGSSSAQSGTAKFYDLFLSIMKCEELRSQYVSFIQQAMENCLWLLNRDNPDIIIEKPIIVQQEMIPVTKQESSKLNNESYKMGTQSLEQTIRNNNPDKSEEWIMQELENIESDKTNQDSLTTMFGNMTANNFNDNTDSQGNRINETKGENN